MADGCGARQSGSFPRSRRNGGLADARLTGRLTCWEIGWQRRAGSRRLVGANPQTSTASRAGMLGAKACGRASGDLRSLLAGKKATWREEAWLPAFGAGNKWIARLRRLQHSTSAGGRAGRGRGRARHAVVPWGTVLGTLPRWRVGQPGPPAPNDQPPRSPACGHHESIVVRGGRRGSGLGALARRPK